MARTYKTLSLSLPPGVVEELAMLGKPTGRVAARVATEIVLREIAKQPASEGGDASEVVVLPRTRDSGARTTRRARDLRRQASVDDGDRASVQRVPEADARA